MSLPAVVEPAGPPSAGARVLHLITRLDRGGSSDNTLRTCLGLDERGWRVTLAYGETTDPSPLLPDVERREGIARVRIPRLVREVRPACDLSAYRAIRRLLLCGDYDVVHTHSSKAGLLGRLAASDLDCPVVHTPHGHVFHGYFGPAASRLAILAERRAARWCRRIVVLTDRGREDHLQARVGRPEQFVTIHSGVPVDEFARGLPDRDSARASFGIPRDAFVAGCVARLAAVKSHETLLDAAALLADRLPRLYVLLVGDGERRARLETHALAAGVGPRVIFAGARADARPALAAMDAFVLPSRNEGQGRAVIEAMAAGVPVVASAVGGLPDVLDGGRCGVLVPPGEPGPLAGAIESLAASAGRAAELADAGRHRAAAFDETTMIDRVEALYGELLREATA